MDASPSPAPATDRVSFTGDGFEYFRIWIVNVALTIATLGVYSAWAKVRRLQYFHRNTRLAGASFDYHADPIAILKGRLIAGSLFLLYTFSSVVSPLFAIVVALAIAAIMPWLVSRSLRFRLHNTSYRGVRFRFSGSTSSAYWIFLGLPLLVALSMFTLGPFWHQRLKDYQFGHSSYGRTPFGITAPVSGFYVVYLIAFGLGLLVLGGFAIALTAAAAVSVVSTGSVEALTLSSAFAMFIAFVIYLAGVIGVQAFVIARTRNLVWDHTTLGECRFSSNVQAGRLAWITLSNVVATIATLGLFWPFAHVRQTKYLAESLSMTGGESLDAIVAASAAEEGAVGEEAAELFDFDIAF